MTSVPLSAAASAPLDWPDAPTTCIGSDSPFLLGGGRLWLVTDGQVDVFSVSVRGGEPDGSRMHLFRVDAGSLLFGVGPERPRDGARALLAVGTAGTRLLPLSSPWLTERAADPECGVRVRALIDEWVEEACAGIVRDVAPKRCVELATGGERKVDGDTSARASEGVAWVRHVAGHSFLLGRPELTVNGDGFTPLSHRAWLQVPEPSTIRLVASGAIADPAELWRGLERLNALVLRCAAMMADSATAAERDRMARKAAALRSTLASACAGLVAAMDSKRDENDDVAPAAGATEREASDPLLAACRTVGRALGVAIVAPPAGQTGPGSQVRDPLTAIARASRLRTRRVALREGWWRHDNGPLLALRGEGGQPVAVVPGGRGAYVLHDPVAMTREPLTAAVAHTLGPFGYTLYRPFPEDALTMRDVVRFGIRGCRPDLVHVIVTGSLAALLGMVPSVATGMLFNTVIPGAERSLLLQMTVVLLVCAFATALFNVTRSIALLRLEGRMAATIQSAVWDRLLSLPVPFFRNYAAGDLAVRAMGIDAIRQAISGSTVTAILGGIFSLFNLALMFWYSRAMAWRATALIGVALGVTALGSWLQLAPQRRVSQLQAKTSGLVLQLLSGIAKLRTAGAEAPAFALWARRFGEQRQLQYKVRRVQNWMSSFNAAFPVLAYTVIFSVALPLLRSADSGLHTGDFLAFLSAYGACQGPLLTTCLALLSTLNVVPLYEQARPILETRPEVDLGKSDPGVLAGDIEVQHAQFRYQAGGPTILRDVTLHAAPGEFVAIVGRSGSGKSTLLRILLGFETLESGAVYYDGQELGGLDILAVRRQIGAVLQSGRLTTGDIFTNIVGSAPLSMDDAMEAARMAGFADDIRAMPMGMHTVVSEGGGTLSGGQRQRLLIARALVHRPRMLLFDEATSALDNRTQAIVSESLARLQATRLVVAHRLSTIMGADRIYVMDRGRVMQTGTYEQLMGEDGPFAELARRQLV